MTGSVWPMKTVVKSAEIIEGLVLYAPHAVA
jgi:hypothetical protein